SLSNNTITGAQNGGLALVLLEGGGYNGLIGNSIVPNPNTGGALGPQFNPLGGAPNSGLLVQANTFNSSGLLIIGINSSLITGNNFNNTATGNSIGIQISTTLGTPGTNGSDGVTIDGNILDATTGSPNLALISQIPQDPGSVTDVYNVT